MFFISSIHAFDLEVPALYIFLLTVSIVMHQRTIQMVKNYLARNVCLWRDVLHRKCDGQSELS